MKNLFLTSSASFVLRDVIKHIPNFKKGMRCVFIPTASEVEKGDMSWLQADRQALVDVGFTVVDFSLTNSSLPKIKETLNESEIVFFSGGNTYFLSQQIQLSSSATYLKEKVEQGFIYIGSSAGSIMAGPTLAWVGEADDKTLAPKLQNLDGLALTDVVAYPHWGNPHFKESFVPNLREGYEREEKVVLLTDKKYLWVKDEWYQIMSI